MDSAYSPNCGVPSRKRASRRWWVAIALFIGAFAALLTRPRQEQAVMLRRYVSPVMPDGSRFTFLYPSDLKVRAWPTRGFSVMMEKRAVFWDNIARLRFPWRGDSEAIVARYIPPTRATGAASPKLRRIDEPLLAGPRFRRHIVDMYDTQWQDRYQLDHTCGYSCLDRFAALDSRIFASFKVLSPGAPLPAP